MNRPLSYASGSNRSSTSLISRDVVHLSSSDGLPPVDAHLVNYLSIQLIKTLRESTIASLSRRAALEAQLSASFATLYPSKTPFASSSTTTTDALNATTNDDDDPAEELDEAEIDAALMERLDGIGFKIGYALSERLTRDHTRFPLSSAPTGPQGTVSSSSADALELLKFISKDLWLASYGKQVDNLRTNHRGVFVIQDNEFRPLRGWSGGEAERDKWVRFVLAVPCGVIRGCLANLGLGATVSADCPVVPNCSFQIKTFRPGQ